MKGGAAAGSGRNGWHPHRTVVGRSVGDEQAGREEDAGGGSRGA